MLVNGLIAIYSLIGVWNLIGFIPQIVTLLRSNGRCEDMSLKTWGTWMVCNMISMLYAIVVLHDFPAIVVAGLGTLGNTTIVSIVLFKRMRSE